MMTGEQRLFRQVLAYALSEDDALEWLASADGRLVCALAGVDAAVTAEKVRKWQEQGKPGASRRFARPKPKVRRKAVAY